VAATGRSFIYKTHLDPGKLTWNLKITQLKTKIIFQTSIVGFHVNFPECMFFSIIFLLQMSFTSKWVHGKPWDPNYYFHPQMGPRMAGTTQHRRELLGTWERMQQFL